MNDDIKLGMDLQKLQQEWGYKELVSFVKGESDSTMYYYKLKPLYDKYGYAYVNQTIIELGANENE